MTSNCNEVNELADAVSRSKSEKNHLYSTQVKLDIETLGDILGQVIKEQEGVRSFELVEKIRHISIQSRIQGSKEFLDELFLIIRHLNAQDSVLVSRAFGHFLNLVNIAESIHGIDIEKKSLKLASNTIDAAQGVNLNFSQEEGTGTHTLTVLGEEILIWATNNGSVGDGTYLVWVEDVEETPNLQGVRLELSGPGLNETIVSDTFRFKRLNDNVTEAPNQTKPYQQPVFLIQVENSIIKRSDKIPVGSSFADWNPELSADIGNLPASKITLF